MPKHIVHFEELPFVPGFETFNVPNLVMSIREFLMGLSSNVNISIKYDGAPAFVYGIERFRVPMRRWVGLKSAVGSDRNRYYSVEQIEKSNWPVVLKKKMAMTLLALSTLEALTDQMAGPEHDNVRNVAVQGDLMFYEGDDTIEYRSEVGDHMLEFRPNTITYRMQDVCKDQWRTEARLGLVLHTFIKGGLTSPVTESPFRPNIDVFNEGGRKGIHLFPTLCQWHYDRQAIRRLDLATDMTTVGQIKRMVEVPMHLEISNYARKWINHIYRTDPFHFDNLSSSLHPETIMLDEFLRWDTFLRFRNLAPKVNAALTSTDNVRIVLHNFKMFSILRHIQQIFVRVLNEANGQYDPSGNVIYNDKGEAIEVGHEGYVVHTGDPVIDYVKIVDRRIFSHYNFANTRFTEEPK